MSIPKISVIMPVYNARPFVSAAIGSVLAQTHADFELIIVDDASTDGSDEMVSAIGDPRIRFLKHAENLGAAAAKNTALKNTRGDLIVFLDADDIALPERFATQVKYLQAHPEISVLGSRILMVDEKDAPMDGDFVCADGPAEIASTLLFQNCVAQSSVMLRREILPPDPFRTELVPAEDYDLWTRLAPNAAFACIDRPLVKYRVHSSGVSARKAEAMRASVKAIHASEIARLEIEPTPARLELHGKICAWPVDATREMVSKAEAWLLLLREVNASARWYPQAAFDHILGRYWYSICADSWQLGGWVRAVFRKSQLRKLTSISLMDHFRILRRTLPVSLKKSR